MRRSKIVSTIGPATEGQTTIKKLIDAGANIFRFNMKYSPPSWHNQRIEYIRKESKKVNKYSGIIVDIPRNDFKIEIKDYDFVALSYLRKAEEIEVLRKKLARGKKDVKIIAKIENETAMNNLEEIVGLADGIMVARGDLGRETPIEELAFYQKKIIDTARRKGRPVIVATEMLYSMTKKNTPTRAEATDVANAVFDGTDALMLSEETAMGDFPVEAVKTMSKIANFCESTGELRELEMKPQNLTDALTASVAWISLAKINNPIKALVAFTRGGATVKLVSRYRLPLPVIAVSNNIKVLNQLNLSYGVVPFFKEFETEKYTGENPIFEDIKKSGLLKKGDSIAVIHGDMWFGDGPANRLSIRTV